MSVKVKICGVTLPEQAREIAVLGADYIGCIVEFPKSPRSITREKAPELQDALKGSGATLVGVAVDMPIEMLFEVIKSVDLKIVQLHGSEPIAYVKRLKEAGVEVWKVTRDATARHSGAKHGGAIESHEERSLSKGSYRSSTVVSSLQDDIGMVDKIVVDAKNPTHGAGGSGLLSDWVFAKHLVGEGYSVVLSGGLTTENVQEGIQSVQPQIVDVSSGVEVSPGIKDLKKVEMFIRKVAQQ